MCEEEEPSAACIPEGSELEQQQQAFELERMLQVCTCSISLTTFYFSTLIVFSSRFALCSLLSALCSPLSALCSMLSVLYSLLFALWLSGSLALWLSGSLAL
jgi:hypothetical protein